MKTFPTKKILYCLLFLMLVTLSVRNVIAGDYLNSSHGNSVTGVDRAKPGSVIDARLDPYSVGNCAHCHLQHASVTDDTSQGTYTAQPNLLSNFNDVTGIAFCTECHSAGGPATDDILTDYNKVNGHGPGNTSHVDTPLECLECHDPHLAQAPTSGTTRGNDATAGSIKGVAGVDVSGSWPIPSAPSVGNESLAAPNFVPIDPITQEWQLCLKCHGGQVTGLTNIAEQINPNNYSAHPVAATTWKNTYLTNNANTALNPPFNVANSPIYCSDCHSSENDASPKGPHGSNNLYMLKKIGPSAFNWAAGPYDALCVDCHDITAGSNFGDHPDGRGAHSTILGCSACHGGDVGAFGGRSGNFHGTNYRFPNGTTKQGAEVPNSGLHSERFLVGGYLTELYNTSVLGGVIQPDNSNSCAASDADAGINDGDCTMGAKGF